MTEVRRAARADVAVLAAVLARAFEDDPVARYLFPDATWRRAMLPRFFRLQLRHNYLPRGEVLTTDALEGAALVMPPHPAAPSFVDRFAHSMFLPLMRKQAGATRILTEALESRRPRQLHYYLGTIGTDPVHQGGGVGSALVRRIVERCDEDGVALYLECSREETTAFYTRFGLKVVEVVQAPETGIFGPRLYLMWRPPPR